MGGERQVNQLRISTGVDRSSSNTNGGYVRLGMESKYWKLRRWSIDGNYPLYLASTEISLAVAMQTLGMRNSHPRR